MKLLGIFVAGVLGAIACDYAVAGQGEPAERVWVRRVGAGVLLAERIARNPEQYAGPEHEFGHWYAAADPRAAQKAINLITAASQQEEPIKRLKGDVSLAVGVAMEYQLTDAVPAMLALYEKIRRDQPGEREGLQEPTSNAFMLARAISRVGSRESIPLAKAILKDESALPVLHQMMAQSLLYHGEPEGRDYLIRHLGIEVLRGGRGGTARAIEEVWCPKTAAKLQEISEGLSDPGSRMIDDVLKRMRMNIAPIAELREAIDGNNQWSFDKEHALQVIGERGSLEDLAWLDKLATLDDDLDRKARWSVEFALAQNAERAAFSIRARLHKLRAGLN